MLTARAPQANDPDFSLQIWGGAVGIGPNDVVLNASYRNADGGDFQVKHPLFGLQEALIVAKGFEQAVERSRLIVPSGS
jgi:hypothetical protein